ncbi:MAG: TetR/AcrR family transcriptional regulator [Gordonibacter pamelaeae]
MENQRVRLSKALLKEALVRLLETKPLDKITIYELCAEAQINRTTFYKYYGSQGDVLKDIENELFAMLETHLVESVKGDEESLASVLKVLGHGAAQISRPGECHARPAVFRAALQPCPGSLLSRCQRVRRLRQRREGVHPPVLCQGGYAIVRAWLNRTPHEPPQDIARLLIGLYARFVREDLRPSCAR